MLATQTLSITNHCNLACTYCWYETGAAAYPQAIAAAGEYAAWFEQCARHEELNRIMLSGGEPTLRGDFAELLDVAHAYFRSVLLLTNGMSVGMNAALIDMLSTRGTFVHVSLDHVSSELSDRVRGGTRATLRGLDALHKAAIPTQVTFVMTSRNSGDLEHVITYCEDHNFDLEVNVVSVPSRHPLSVTTLSDDERGRLGALLTASAEILGRPSYYARVRDYLATGAVRPLTGCRAVANGVFIESDGAVFLCGQRRDDCLGDIRTSSPESVVDMRTAALQRRSAGPCVSLDCLTVA